MSGDLEQDGFAIVPDVLSEPEREALVSLLGPIEGAGRRGLLSIAAVATLANSRTIVGLVSSYLAAPPVPVRAIYFDKSANANWLVPWHQDLTLALQERRESVGFGPWSTKDGIAHVQPPVELLERMLTVRLHLDAADESNGALRVLPGSHRFGRLGADRVRALRDEIHEVVCNASAGDALLMRPLLLHASSRSTRPAHRRVLHIEYAGFALPDGLRWHEAA